MVLFLGAPQERRDEPARNLLHLRDAPLDRAAVHVNVVDGEEGADPEGLTTRDPVLVRLLDVGYEAVGRGVYDVRVRLQGPLRIPEDQQGCPRGRRAQPVDDRPGEAPCPGRVAPTRRGELSANFVE